MGLFGRGNKERDLINQRIRERMGETGRETDAPGDPARSNEATDLGDVESRNPSEIQGEAMYSEQDPREQYLRGQARPSDTDAILDDVRQEAERILRSAVQRASEGAHAASRAENLVRYRAVVASFNDTVQTIDADLRACGERFDSIRAALARCRQDVDRLSGELGVGSELPRAAEPEQSDGPRLFREYSA